MRYILFLTIISLLKVYPAIGQGNVTKKYRIQLTDKKNNPYSISEPLSFLSSKAWERRIKHNIAIESNDLPVNPSYLDSVRATGAKIHSVSKWLNTVTADADSNALMKISKLPFVSKIEKVYQSNGEKRNTAVKDGFSLINNLTNRYSSKENNAYTSQDSILSYRYNYGLAFNQIDMVGGPCLHNIGYNGKGVIIAIFDAGFANVDNISFFSNLWSSGRLLGTRDFVNPGANVFKKGQHGTNVLSTMAANINGVYVGTAPEANYWLVCTEDAMSEYPIEEDNWVAAAEFADSAGVDIISSSLGYTNFDDTSMGHWYWQMDGKTTIIAIGADIAASKGMIIVNSAGNSANQPWHYIGTPADAERVLTVGAVNIDGKYAPFSSVGPTADGRIKPDVVALGNQVSLISSDNRIISGSGTSFSTPIIAGMMACLVEAHPYNTNIQLMDAVKKSSSIYSNPNNMIGYGIPNFLIAHMILSNVSVNNDQIKVFPNPFKSNICTAFISSGEKPLTTEIFDVMGKRVFFNDCLISKNGYNTLNFDNLDRLSRGLYFLKISSSDLSFSYKLFKQ
ncbi:MAG: S8 family serine peptidase [Bacteroidota bacterium]|nr:S8 family serine peptidase [Bacteroidota bacterium]